MNNKNKSSWMLLNQCFAVVMLLGYSLPRVVLPVVEGYQFAIIPGNSTLYTI